MLHQTFHCPENWDNMQPTPQGRFCGVCQKNVFDFTDKTNEEILELLKTTGKSFCGRSSAAQLQDFNQYNTQRQLKAKAALFLLGLLLVGCEPASKQDTRNVEQLQQTSETAIDNSILVDILASAPLDISFIVKDLDSNKAVFKKQNLLPIRDLTQLTPEQLSFLYGQYAVNIWYAYLFKEMELVAKYQAQQRAIEQKLGIQELIPHKEFTRLFNKKNEEDSLLNMTQLLFEKIALEQEKNHTNHHIINILAGSFIEATYLLSTFYEQIPNDMIMKKMGECKLTLEQINLVSEIYKDKLFYHQDFLALQKKYAQFSITVKRLQNTKVIEVAGEMILDTIEEPEIKIYPHDFQDIREMTKALRQKYIQE